MDKPQVTAWFVDDPIADDDPLAHIKRRAAAEWTAAEVLEEAARSAAVAARAERVAKVAGLLADPAFDPHEVMDAARAAGMSEADLDAAGYLAVVLAETETSGPQALRWVVRQATAARPQVPRTGNRRAGEGFPCG